jgi:hypothetical protein
MVGLYAVVQQPPGPAKSSHPSPAQTRAASEAKLEAPFVPQTATQPQPITSSESLSAVRNSMVFAFVLTLVISLVEIPAKSKMGPKACYWNGSFPLYLLILSAGNCVAALFCSQILTLSGQLVYFAAFLNGFFGVFAFQGIMSNTNITFLDKGVLTIEEWIAKARDYAIAAAIQKQARDEDETKNKIALELVALDEGTLDTYIDTKLGKPEFDSITASAQTHDANRKLYKALAFAGKNLAAATAVARALKKK